MTQDERELLILVGQVCAVLCKENGAHNTLRQLAPLLLRVTDTNKLKLVGDK